MVKRLGAAVWRRVHRVVYLAGALAVLHYFWLAKVGWIGPYVYAGWLALALGVRAGDAVRRRVARRRRQAAATPVASGALR
jgi:sulfoxide reductase heme-binding subunit YedZ